MGRSPSRVAALWIELRRRGVLRAGATYLLAAWLVLQITDMASWLLELPTWVGRLVLVVLATGLPIALVLAWAFEWGPEGLKRARRAGETSAGAAGPAAARARRAGWAAIGMLAVLTAGAAATRAALTEPLDSVAVLPFEEPGAGTPEVRELTGGELRGQTALANGWSEEILNQLARVPGLTVTSWSASRQLARARARLAGERLGTAAVLAGEFVRSDGRVSVAARLVRTRDGKRIWADAYSGEDSAEGLLRIQDEILREVLTALGHCCPPEWPPQAGRTADARAYERYLEARDLFARRSGPSLQEAAGRLEEALARDPVFATANALLALVGALLPEYSGASAEEWHPRVREAALRALAADSGLAEAHLALAKYHDARQEWLEAEAAYRRALDAAPSYGYARQGFAWHLQAAGNLDEAIIQLQKAVEVDPLTHIVSENLGYLLYLARRYDEAIAQERRTLELVPGFHVALVGLARSLLAAGRCEEALATAAEIRQDSDRPNFYHLGELAHVYAGCGREHSAREILKELQSRPDGPVYPSLLALSYIKLGELGTALDLLEQAKEKEDVFLPYIVPSDPALDPIRQDPRYVTLARSLGVNPRAAAPLSERE